LAEPWLSVLLPTYNGGRFLARALESIARERATDVEVIVADDGSRDDTLAILEAYQGRLPLRLVPGARRGNWVASTNACLRAARGRYLSLLHQDDVWLPGRLGAAREALAGASPPGLFFSAADFLDGADRRLGSWRAPFGEALLAPEQLLPALLVQNFIAVPAPVFERRAAEELGGLDEDLWYTADWDLWLRLAGRGAAAYRARPLVGFRVHAGSQTVARSRTAAEFREQHQVVFQRHLAGWRSRAPSPRAVRRVETAAQASMAVNVALSAVLHGQPWPRGGTLLALARLGPFGLVRYLRDSRIHERVAARLRARIAGKGRGPSSTADPAYAQRLAGLQAAWWKRLLDVQRPYRTFLRRLELGRTLDLGCGVGRMLTALPQGSVGVDHNATAVALARQRGLTALTPEELTASPHARPGQFDSLLLAHVAEHMLPEQLVVLLRGHLALLRPGGRVVVITPQERGHGTDATHVCFMDFEAVARAFDEVGLETESQRSFPFPRWAGRFFSYNEFVSIGRKA